MKRFVVFLSIFSLILNLTYANPIDENTAKIVGQNFLFAQSSSKLKQNLKLARRVTLERAKTINSSADGAFYIFNVPSSQGFVIVSASDNVTPILGYSYDGNIDPDSINPTCKAWLDNYKEQIQYVIDNNLQATEKIKDQWQKLQIAKNQEATVIVAPLIQTKWGQGKFYNFYCPIDKDAKDENDNKCLTGCGATAMAQIMNYWKYPIKGNGTHSYTPKTHPEYGTLSADFGNTTYNWENSSSVVNSFNDDVAKLMSHCGVAVEMDYSPNVSLSNSLNIRNALIGSFNYDPSVLLYKREDSQYWDDNNWITLIKHDLNLAQPQPVLYIGADDNGNNGHIWVCDGFDSEDNFHMNWGWDGNTDGYFPINSLNPGTSNFSYNQLVYLGVHPIYFDVEINSNPLNGGTVTGQGKLPLGSTCTLTATPNSGYTFVNWTDPKGAEISTSSTFSFTVTKDSTLTANFSNGNNTIPPPVFNPNVTYGTITDIDGNVYKTVTIGTQTWMAENLKVTRYNDGTAIPNVTDNAAWAGLSTGAYCWYNNDISHKATYGALYNWYAVNTGKLAPAGWHVPTDGEWTTLTTYLGESVAGDKLTETGISHWANPNAGATNETGFTALPGGHSDGFFGFIGYIGCWWSATEYDPYSVFFRSLGLGPINGIVSRGINGNKSVGYSVRCVKDDATTAPTLSTTQISGITTTTATGGGNITSDGGSAVTARGVCWNTTGSPTISDSKTSDGTGAGEFVSSLTNLAKETTYYVRAYATNSIGTAYGNEFSFNTLSESNTVTEISINISFPGTLSTSLSNEQLLTIENLKISGNIDARDFKTLRFSMPKLNKLNLKEVNISSYFGIEGTCHHENLFYPRRMIPDSTFSRRGDDFNDDFIQFSSIILPDALDSIGYASFCASEISKITIPDTDYKITIGDNAFTSCNLLNQIELLTTKIPNISRNTLKSS